MTTAGARSLALIRPLARMRWRRFASMRFLGLTLAATALVQTITSPANAPSGAAPAASVASDRAPYVSFSVALREAYAQWTRAEREALGGDFDGAVFERHLKLLDERIWPEPARPAARRLEGAAAVVVDEARARLLRLYAIGAREANPHLSATAQTALECWASRAAARRDRAAIAECSERFHAAVVALEDGLLPLKTPDPFQRRLAREYLAYANYKAAAEGDEIDARHFADKGLRAAEGAAPVEPEELERWFAIERGEARELAFWRIRLDRVLEKHRAGPRAAGAAVALARFDCWAERAAERAAADSIAKCRGEFIDAMRQLEEGGDSGTETVPVRFPYDRLALGPAERAKITRAARLALERNAAVSVSALAAPQSRDAVEARQAWRRAETVAALLTRLGIPAERIRLVQRAALPAERESGVRRVDIVLD